MRQNFLFGVSTVNSRFNIFGETGCVISLFVVNIRRRLRLAEGFLLPVECPDEVVQWAHGLTPFDSTICEHAAQWRDRLPGSEQSHHAFALGSQQ